MNLFVNVDDFNGNIPEPDIIRDDYIRWTGKQAVSVILPPINISNSKVTIENGLIKKGQVNKGVSNTIVHIIFKDYDIKWHKNI